MENRNNFKNKDASNNPIVLLGFGLLLIIATIAIYFLTQDQEKQMVLYILLAAMGLGGISFILYGIYRFIVLANLKKLAKDPNAYETKAKFIKAYFSGATGSDMKVLGVPTNAKVYAYQKIQYEYTDGMNHTYTVKSNVSYTINQVKYLEELGTFKIKCKGKRSIITEEIPDIDTVVDVNLFKGRVKTPLNKEE